MIVATLMARTGRALALSLSLVAPITALAAGADAPAAGTKPPSLPSGMSAEELKAVIDSQLPLSPAQVRATREAGIAVERATKERVGPSPTPVSTTIRIRLSPGVAPQVLRVAAGYASTLVFSDATGAPWNVMKVRAGQKGQIEIPDEVNEERGAGQTGRTNMFTVTPLSDVVSTNLVVFLQDSPVPIVLLVASGQPEVDLRADAIVQARGPGAVAPLVARTTTDSIPVHLTSMLSGIAPSGAKALKILKSDVPDVQAWVLGARMYVRSRANVLSPPVPSDGKVASGPDGTKVFELPFAPEVLLMQGGSVGKLSLGGFPAPSLKLDQKS
jgi:intracellular multiplication protein IcmK